MKATVRRPRVFLANGSQGVNSGRNVWHHPLMSVGAVSEFMVVDREGPGNHLEEFHYDEAFVIPIHPKGERD